MQWNKTREDFFKKYTSHFIWKVRKGHSRFYCERELETEQRLQCIDPPTLMAISVVSFSFSRAAQPEVQRPTLLGAGFLYRILSPTGLQTPSGVPRAPSAGCGFPYHISSLTRLIYNSPDLQLSRGPRGPPPPGVGFLYHIFALTSLVPNSQTSCLTELYNSSFTHSIAHSIFGMACSIVIKRK